MPADIVQVHIAKSPCYPPYGAIVVLSDGRELWDCDCAAGTEEQARRWIAEEHPGVPFVDWDDPRHYSKPKPRKPARADDETSHFRSEC